MTDLLTIREGDCLEQLRTLPDGYAQCVVTSPPYFGLRDYKLPPTTWPSGWVGCHGLEPTPELYVQNSVAIFKEVRRVLKDDGTLWLNLGDSYASSPAGNKTWNHGAIFDGRDMSGHHTASTRSKIVSGLKSKNLIGIPWRVAFALQSDGWYLRQWIPWVKRNSMPESVTDRPASACEVFFLLSKSESYFYDHEAVKLPASPAMQKQIEEGYNGKATKDFIGNGVQDASAVKSRIIAGKTDKQRGHSQRHAGFNERWDKMSLQEQCGGWRSTRNSDWFFESLPAMLLQDDGLPLALTANPQGFKGSHFATFPPKLIEPCILAGSKPGDMILDPFGGAFTTALVALSLNRKATVCELNPEYIKLGQARCADQLRHHLI